MISDGAGSADLGGEGASLVCRSLMSNARAYLSANRVLPDDEEIRNWFDKTRDLLGAVASRHSREFKDFACTSVFVLSDINQTIVAHVGDGCAVLRDESSGQWIVPSWPYQGEYAATTHFVTDANELQLRIVRHTADISAFAVFSDGIERLALDFSTRQPSQRFFDKMAAPIAASQQLGRNAKLSLQLKEYLASPAVNARTDDDKSLVIAVRK
jgi:hypothetical protein